MADYPDSEVLQLVTTASRITGMPVRGILMDFGEFIAPDLLQMYGGVINPAWKTLDVIENTENEIHNVVRLYNRDAHPPELIAIDVGNPVVLRQPLVEKCVAGIQQIERAPILENDALEK